MVNLSPEDITCHSENPFLCEITATGKNEIGTIKIILDKEGKPNQLHFRPYAKSGLEEFFAKTKKELKAKIAEQLNQP